MSGNIVLYEDITILKILKCVHINILLNICIYDIPTHIHSTVYTNIY